MKPNCPHSLCLSRNAAADFHPTVRPSVTPERTSSTWVIRRGRYFRSSDSRWIQRYQCRACFRLFSSATSQPAFAQKKRRINSPLFQLLNSGVSQRRAARILKVNPKTVVRRFRWLADQARIQHEAFLTQEFLPHSVQALQFDDLETHEHSKLKPLSVALAVQPESRKILGFAVSRMPAKGLLARPALKKYGPRADERAQGWNRLFESLKPIVHPRALWRSDQNPHYPRHLKAHHPECRHETVKGRRGCVAGQGELKKIGNDPLFSLNHTCAMTRANLNRLFRRTWCSTKTVQGLLDHLAIYCQYHNQILT